MSKLPFWGKLQKIRDTTEALFMSTHTRGGRRVVVYLALHDLVCKMRMSSTKEGL